MPQPETTIGLECPMTEWEANHIKMERAPAGTIAGLVAEIERLRGQVRALRSVVESAIEWDGADDEGVPAVWFEAAELALREAE